MKKQTKGALPSYWKAKEILPLLCKQKFADWYNTGRFNAFITGEPNAPLKEEILIDLQKMLKS